MWRSIFGNKEIKVDAKALQRQLRLSSINACAATIGIDEFNEHFYRDKNFTYGDMLDHYCDAVGKFGKIDGCFVKIDYNDGYITVTLIFCDSSKHPVQQNGKDYKVTDDVGSLDAQFLQFMKGRSEAYFTPTIQEIVKRMKK